MIVLGMARRLPLNSPPISSADPPARNSRARSQAQTPCSAWHSRRSMAWGWKGCVPWCGVRTGWTHFSKLKQVRWSCSTYQSFWRPNYDTTQTPRGQDGQGMSRHNPRNKVAPGAQSVPCSIQVGSTHPDLRAHIGDPHESPSDLWMILDAS